MRRILSVALSLVLLSLSLLTAVSASESITLAISDATAKPGEEFSVTVSLDNNPGVAGLDFFIDYDSDALTLLSAETQIAAGTWDVTSIASDRHVYWYNTSNYTENGSILKLNFKASNTAAITSAGYAIGLYFDDWSMISNAAGEELDYQISEGTVLLIHDLVKTAANDPSCTEAGNIEYYTCKTCGRSFTDAAGEHEIALKDVVLPAAGHKTELVPAKDATTAAIGNHAYYVCSVCHKAFKDSEAKQPTTVEAETIARIVKISVESDESCGAAVDEESVTAALNSVTSQIGLAEATEEAVTEALADSVPAEKLDEISAAVAEALDEGKAVTVEMSMGALQEEDLDKDTQELIAQKLPQDEKNVVVAAYLDIAIELKAKGESDEEAETLGNVTQLAEPVTVTVELSQADIDRLLATQPEGRSVGIYVARVHEGDVDLIPATVNYEAKTLTFASDRFSLFSVVTITYTNGDITGDDNLNADDLIRFMNYLSGAAEKANVAAADPNGDNAIDLRDLVWVMKELAKTPKA